MSIEPTKPGSTPPPGPGRLDRAASPAPARPEDGSTSGSAGKPARDKVQISDAARDLQDQLQNRREVTQLSPGRLHEVLERFTGGFYDRPEVRGVVVDRIAEELGASSSSSEA